MQLSWLKQRFSTVEDAVHSAAEACNEDSNPSEELENCLAALNKQCAESKAVVEQAESQDAVLYCVDKLEELGDKTWEACLAADDIDQELHDAVRQAHQAISQLKHQLH